jgi:hypothetical protein
MDTLDTLDTLDVLDTTDVEHRDDLLDTVRFEPCAGYRPAVDDDAVCRCGWLEADHGELATARAARRLRQPGVTRAVSGPVRRAS